MDGVIFATAVASSKRQHQMIARRKPVVFLNRKLSGQSYDAVISDNYKGGQVVAEYFVKGRRRHIGLLTGFSEASTILDREKGFMEKLKRATKPIRLIHPPSQFTIFTYENGFQAMQALLRLAPDVDAVFCTNDIIAIGALDGARACGKRVPEDLWVMGYDDIPMAGWEAIGLTTIRQPLASMATQVVDRLLLRIKNPELKPETVRLPNELVIRETTSKTDK